MPLTRCLVILLFVGCRACGDLETGREYPCARDAGGAQCAEGWQCGIDGRCHSSTVGSDIACAQSSDCATGWRCGLNGRCHDATVAAPYACASDGDCTTGWRCGLDAHCHDTSVAAAYACHSDSDCESAWPCGPEGVCHDPDAGAPYPCTVDAQCGGDWRCGLEGTCVDWRPEGLRAGLYEGPLDESRLNPATPPAPELVAISFDDAGVATYAMVARGALTIVAQAHAISFALDAGAPRALALYGTRAFVADELGLVELPAAIRRPLAATRLRAAYGVIAGCGDAGVWMLDPSTGFATHAPPLLRADAGGQEIFDIAILPQGVIAAAEEGLFLTGFDGGWQPMPFGSIPNAQCPGPSDGGFRVRGIDVHDSYNDSKVLNLSAERWPGDGGPELFLIAADGLQGTCSAPAWSQQEACPLCDPGQTLADFTESAAWCRDSDGGETLKWVSYCMSTAITWQLHGPTVAGHSSQSYSAHADVAGHVVAATSGPTFTALIAPTTDGLMRVGTQRWMGAAWFEAPGVGFVPGGLGLVEADAFFKVTSSTGYVHAFAPQFVFGDALDEAFADPGYTPISGRVYAFGSGALELTNTYDLALGAPSVALRSGGLLIAAFDDRLAAAGTDGVLAVKLAPRPFDAIRSMAFSGDAGYALTGTALFHVVAHSLQHWTADEIIVPDGERVGVWLDGQAGRLGYTDGTVLSLPSRVSLSQPLPADERVVQYSQLCGQPVALAAGGLYRLQASGEWVLEPLPSVGPDREFAGGRIDVEGDSLLVTTGGGTLIRLAPPMSCP
jgi:hypothetical protein